MPKNKKTNKGFTLVELIIGVAVFGVIATAFYFSINVVIDTVEISRRRSVATNIANEQMETLRNMPYADIGTLSGNPAGAIPQSQTITVDNIDYVVETYITYVDDEYDDVFPADLYSADYKRARISVCWSGGLTCPSPTVLISDFSTNTVETGAGTGVMKITVNDEDAQGVQGAQVIVSRDDPAVYIEGYTNSDGELVQPLLDPSYNNYHVVASKPGYGTDYTSEASANLDPGNPDKSIIAGDLTEVTLYIDLLSDLTVNTIESSTGNPIPGVNFQLTGLRKLLGTDGGDPALPVYKYQQNHTTDAFGTTNIVGLEGDYYEVLLNAGSETQYSVAAFDHPGMLPDPITTMNVESGTTPTLNVYLDTYTPYNILFTVRNEDGELIQDAQIQLVDGEEYNETRPTTVFGQEFFRELEAKTYTYTITKDGYATATADIEVAGQEQPEIILTPL